MSLNPTQREMSARAFRRTFTSLRLGLGHVLAAGKLEVKLAEKAGWKMVEELRGVGAVFMIPEPDRTKLDIETLSQLDFSEVDEDTKKVELKVGGFDVDIYYSKHHGYFPIIRKCRDGEDYELCTFMTLPGVRAGLRAALLEFPVAGQ